MTVAGPMSTLIPVNDLGRYAASVRDAASARAAEVIASGYYILGPWTQQFERAFADYVGQPHCIGVGNGTDALEIALRCVGVDAGDRVVLAANAAMYGTGAALAIGAEPVFADVDPAHGLLTVEAIERAVGNLGAKAVIVTHLYGRLAQMEALVAFARARGIAVVEDCAQAHGAADAAGTRAGAFGDIATFSFYPTKNLGAVGDGGAIVCADDKLADRARQLRQYGWTRKYCNAVPHGRNSRLDELQAALLQLFLSDLDARNAARRQVANRYSAEIQHPAIVVPGAAGDEFVAHLFVVQTTDRDHLAAHLRDSGVATDIHYPTPDYRQPVHGDRFSGVFLPVTERLCDQVLTLPCFPELRSDEVDRVVAACNTWRSP